MFKIVSWPIAALTLYVIGANMLALSSFSDYDYQGNQDKGGWRTLTAPDGSIYVAGTGLSDNDGYDFVLLKYRIVDGELAREWAASYDGPISGSTSDDIVAGMALDDAGNIYVGGTSYQSVSTGSDFTVVAFEPVGSGDT